MTSPVYVTSDGTAEAEFTTQRFHAADLAGRAVILHAGADNFGNVPVGPASNHYTANSADATTATANTGNAGTSHRLRCGGVMRRAVRLILLGVLCGAGWGVAARGGCA